AACTFRLAKVLNLDPLLALPRAFIYVALIAWCATFVGLLIHLAFNAPGVGPRPSTKHAGPL
ncbi:MAG TPA: hypothetical protein VN541_21460, partial [Tepidisphaeraceae bacterium]|nr:hypothetical protein [Tepidisphaeraceae bacterium]